MSGPTATAETATAQTATAEAATAETISAAAARRAPADRRHSLLEAAVELLGTGDVDDVSMESVAKQAGVSRPLVYKHFANRQDLLSALYERESAHIHHQLAADVQAATTLTDMLRALVRGMLNAQATRGVTFATLASSGRRSARQRQIQRRRNRQTARYFTQQATREFDLAEPVAAAAIAVALASITTIVGRWREDQTRDHAALLEDVFVGMAMGGLRELSGQRESP